MSPTSIGVESFGPIAKAEVELKPLTIFVGPNNSGKSYMALLFYAVSRGFAELAEDIQYYFTTRTPYDRRTLEALSRLLPADLYEGVNRPAFVQRLARKPFDVPFDPLPKRIKEDINSHVEEYLDFFRESVSKQIKTCYGAKLSDLVCKIDTSQFFSLSIQSEQPYLALNFRCTRQKLEQIDKVFSLKGQTMRARFLDRYRVDRIFDSTEETFGQRVMESIANSIVGNSHRNVTGILATRPYYLPAARSGILHGQKAIARAGLKALQLAGIEPISIPRLPGVTVDFLDAIYSIDRDVRGTYYSMARALETSLMPGRIELVERKEEPPEIFFREPQVGRLALHRTSSMISELAPIILLLRYKVRRGDIVIIEEPESHMHPNAQREFARWLARLAKAGVKVLLTTHSDYFLQQMSNLVALGYKSERLIKQMGYVEEDIVSPKEVCVYLFTRASWERGSIATRLEVGEDGITDEAFGEVAEALYHETIDIRRKSGGD